MNMIEGLLVSLFTYFDRRPKQCVELAKIASIMETNGQKILWSVKTRWIIILALCKKFHSDCSLL
jgi:hypothetical protein